ncbi:hypothetical protein MTR67_018455 [Solanum verrucosum]|uniref:Uncharacterized protein n=1 Tax=Solanum verrucosum TaxID=315347 RepID=A0AAF0QMD9_SOLVR|nr:hypothetical protein MTR67_018455 [Solanum verrucosum]
MIKKCVGDLTSIVPLEGLGVNENLSYEEVSIEILGQQVKKLRNKEVAPVKVLWRNVLVEGYTWEAEATKLGLSERATSPGKRERAKGEGQGCPTFPIHYPLPTRTFTARGTTRGGEAVAPQGFPKLDSSTQATSRIVKALAGHERYREGIWIDEQRKDTNLQKGIKRAEGTKKCKPGDRQAQLASRPTNSRPPKVPVCQALKERTILARERNRRQIAEWFRDAVLDRPKLHTLRMLKAKVEGRWK